MGRLKSVTAYILVVAAAFVLLVLKPFGVFWLDAGTFLAISVILLFAVLFFGNDKDESLKLKLKQLDMEIKMLNKEVEVASSQIMSVSEQLYLTLDENNAFAQQLFAEAREMSDMNKESNEQANKVISGINEITDLLRHAGEVSADMEKTSDAAGKALKAGLIEIREMVSAVRDIQEASDTTKDSMERLSRTSDEIMNILDTVKSISTQTHLLSLNAAIESAKAGEAGKGFAVVAGEIQKLSIETGKAVKNIGELVNTIGQQIQAVNNIVEENTRRVQVGVDVSGIIEHSTQIIDKSFSDINAVIKDICSITARGEELARGLGSMVSGMESNMECTSVRVDEVYKSVHKQKHNIQDLADLGNRLDDASKNLRQLVAYSSESEDTGADKVKVEQAVKAVKGLTAGLNSQLTNLDAEKHKAILTGLLNSQNVIEAAWTNDAKGRFICSIPQAGIANAIIREWFKRSISGEEYISNVYISAITRKPCVTYSVPIVDDSGKIIGVFGVDLKL